MVHGTVLTDKKKLSIRYSEDSAPQEGVQETQATEAERRRQLYERIRRGNAMADAEEAARRRWSGR